MLSVVGLNCKVYWEVEELPEVSCPNPGCEGVRLRGPLAFLPVSV